MSSKRDGSQFLTIWWYYLGEFSETADCPPYIFHGVLKFHSHLAAIMGREESTRQVGESGIDTLSFALTLCKWYQELHFTDKKSMALGG